MINNEIDNIIDNKLIDWDSVMLDLKLLIDREIYKIVSGEVPSTIGQLYNDVLGVIKYHGKKGQAKQLKALESEQMKLYDVFVKPLEEHYGRRAPKFEVKPMQSNKEIINKVASNIYYQAKKGATDYVDAIKSTRK